MRITKTLCTILLLSTAAACSPGVDKSAQDVPTQLITAKQSLPHSNPIQNNEPPKFKGVDIDQNFTEKLNNPDERFARLEQAVINLRKEYKTLESPSRTLGKSEDEFQILVQKLEDFLTEIKAHKTQTIPHTTYTPQTSRATSAPLKITAPHHKKIAPTIKPVKNMSEKAVTAIRIGEHAGKTRIVFELTQKTNVHVELDQSENFLLVEFPNTKWRTTSAKTMFAKSPLISSYSATSMDNTNSRIIIPLKKKTTILEQKMLPPTPSSQHHRVYIDLKK